MSGDGRATVEVTWWWQDSGDGGAGTWHFWFDREVGRRLGLDPLEAIKAAAIDYFRRNKGEVWDMVGGYGSANWGDAVEMVDAETWARYGLEPRLSPTADYWYTVNHDEGLYAVLDEDEDE